MSSNGQINQQQQPQKAALLFSGPGHAVQILSVNAENFAMQNDELSLIQELHGDGQGIPLRSTSGSSLSLDMQGQGTASSIVPSPILPTAGAAMQAAGGTHIHGQTAQLAIMQSASSQPPSNALLADASLSQQLMDASMSQRRLLSENQQLMDALARVCPECSTAVIILLLEMLDRETRTVIEHEERQAMAKQIVELRTAFNELAAKLAEIRQDGRGDDSELSEDEM